MRLRVVFFVCIAIVAATTAQIRATPPAARIIGRVVSAESHQAVRLARVRLTGGPRFAKSAIFGGREALDVLLEVPPDARGPIAGALTVAMSPASVEGTIEDASSKPVTDCMVVLFPTDSRYWLPHARRIRAVQPSSTGAFLITDLPAGEYRLAAVRDADPDAWCDATFLKTLVASSVPVVLQESGRVTQRLRIQ